MPIHVQQRAARKPLSCLAMAALAALATHAATATAQAVLEEVVVTAQKRSQSLQDVPLAVSAIDAQAMRDAGIGDIEDLARQVPTLQIQSTVGPMSVNYRVRRVGNIGNIPTFEPAVGVFQDGAYRNRPIFTAGDMFDVERVEVLRGPQSTLYGKNTTAGVVAIYSKAPAEAFEGSAQVDAGIVEGASDAALYRFVGGVSGPLTDTVGGSIGISAADQEPTFDSALSASNAHANDLDRQTVRGQLQWAPTDALDIRLIGNYLDENDDTYLSDVYIVPGSSAQAAQQSLIAAGTAQSCSSNDPLDQRHCARDAATTDLEASDITLLADYILANDWTVTSISSWDWFKYKGTQDDIAQVASPILKFHDTQEAHSWQQELRLTSVGGETVDWLAGLFYYKNDFNRGDNGDRFLFLEDIYSAAPATAAMIQKAAGAPIPVPAAVPGQNGIYDASQDTEYLGLFGQATWNITDDFSVTGGLRWQEEQKNASLEQGVTVPGFSLLSFNLLPAAIGGDLDRTTDEVTWSVTPQYFIQEDTSVYATVAHGFKSGGFNVGWGTTPMNQRQFQDESIMHYETGLKTNLLDDRMQLALSAFYTEYDDYQDAAFISQQFTVGNAEKAELKGAEAEARMLFGEHVSADAGISFADFTYAKYTNGLCYPGRTPTNPANGTCNLDGEHPINAPEWTTHLGLMYQTDVRWGEVYARTDWAWSDNYNTSYSADPRLVQDSYSWVNFRLGTRWARYEAVVWLDNALDEDVTNVDAQLNLFAKDPSYQTFRQAPRSFGLTLRADF